MKAITYLPDCDNAMDAFAFAGSRQQNTNIAVLVEGIANGRLVLTNPGQLKEAAKDDPALAPVAAALDSPGQKALAAAIRVLLNAYEPGDDGDVPRWKQLVTR